MSCIRPPCGAASSKAGQLGTIVVRFHVWCPCYEKPKELTDFQLSFDSAIASGFGLSSQTAKDGGRQPTIQMTFPAHVFGMAMKTVHVLIAKSGHVNYRRCRMLRGPAPCIGLLLDHRTLCDLAAKNHGSSEGLAFAAPCRRGALQVL